MAGWTPVTTTTLGGRFKLMATRINKFAPVDITVVRLAPTQIQSYSNADPFGDATLSLEFPSITSFDDWSSPDLITWLADDADLDLWWIPGHDPLIGRVAPPGEVLVPWVSGLTNLNNSSSPEYNYTFTGGKYIPTWAGVKIWEGFFSSFDLQGSSLTVQCQGALYQADGYYQKPFYPPNPQTLESLIMGVFDKTQRPHLRTSPPRISFPAGWTLTAPPAGSYSNPNVYSPNIAPGAPWTGYDQRDTGTWIKALTGFTQSLLPVMITQANSGATPGNQWTLMQALQGDASYPAGRTPVLQVRDRNRAADFSFWNGTPGLQLHLTRDNTQSADVVYGSGTDLDGAGWTNSKISLNGQRTDYLPLAALASAFPSTNNPSFDPSIILRESYTSFGSGFNQTLGVAAATDALVRNQDAGWSGTLTVSSDPSSSMSRWMIRAGMTVTIQGLLGAGAHGISFHIAAVTANPMAGTVEMTIDTRFRDLLSVEEAYSRTVDAMTPQKMLLAGQSSFILPDLQFPWSYAAGSGYVPTASTAFYNYIGATPAVAFPWKGPLSLRNPGRYPQFFVQCNADAFTAKGRWAGSIPIRMSERGEIARTEFFVCDANGTILNLPFHVSLYFVNVGVGDMPYTGIGASANYSPFQTNAFTKINPATGQPWGPAVFLKPQDTFLMGWGVGGQMAGYSPGRSSDVGTQPTGLLVDETPWPFDMTAGNPSFDPNALPGKQDAARITVYAMFYANTTADVVENPAAVASQRVYFGGRLYLHNPGGTP